MDSSRARLEKLCIERNRRELLRGVRRFIKQGGARNYSDGMEWLWRAGMIKDVLSLSLPKIPSARELSFEKLGVVRSLWLARAWVASGAWIFSRAIFRQIPATEIRSIEARILAAELLHADADFGRSLELIEGLEERGLSESWGWQLLQVRLKSLTSMEYFEPALERLRKYRRDCPSAAEVNSIHLRILEGWLRGRGGKPGTGIKSLEDLLVERPDFQRTHPRFFSVVHGVLGELHALQDDRMRARRHFMLAYRSARSHDSARTPHAELDPLIKLATCGLASRAVVERLKAYPALPPVNEQRVAALDCRGRRRPAPGVDIRIDLANGECFVSGRIRPEVPLEIRLAGILANAGSIGISLPLAYTLLWPGEPWNWFQFNQRISKLAHRLRRVHRIGVRRERETLQLKDPRDGRRIHCGRGVSVMPSFLQKRPGRALFRAVDVSEYYSISQRQATHLLKDWLKSGWISREGAGPSTRYSIPPT